jgi:hypothetical protein
VNFIVATDSSLISITGAPVGKAWLKLNRNTVKGDFDIYLNESVPSSWRVDDKLMISATGFRPEESEIVEIAKISGNYA